MIRGLTLALLASACFVASCSSAPDPRYCDESTPCADPRWPDCDYVAHQCNAATDAGTSSDGLPTNDSGQPPQDGPLPEDGPPPDGSVDGGCGAGLRECADGCFALDDPTHCGASCAACGGQTPGCDGTACVCTATSCPAATPICDSAGTCRTCATHAECTQRDGLAPVCATNGACVPATCGDTVVSPTAGERCDYGDTTNYDGCDPKCRYIGTVTTIAGKAGGLGYCDAAGTSARLTRPAHVASSSAGLFFTESTAHTLRKVTTYWRNVATVAGSYGLSGSTDGTGADARFNAPRGVATDGTVIYIADSNNYVVRRTSIDTGATVTIAGSPGLYGTSDGAGVDARFRTPHGLALHGSSLYVADRDNYAVRMIDLATSGFPVSTVAGTPGSNGGIDGDKATARLGSVEAVVADSSGVLFVADYSNSAIRRVDTDGTVSTPYGALNSAGSADGVGSAARFNAPSGIAYLSSTPPVLIVSDSGNHTLRKIDLSTGMVSTLAGLAGQSGSADGTGSAARFDNPKGIAVESHAPGGPNVYVVDNSAGTIRLVDTASGAVSTYVGAAAVDEAADGTGPTARFGGPGDMLDLGDYLLVADSGGNALRQLWPSTGQVVTVAGSLGLAGQVDDVGPAARFKSPTFLAMTGGRVFVLDSHAIREFDPASKAVQTRAGGEANELVDGDGTAAGFYFPFGMAADTDYLYISDLCTIRRMTITAPWTVTTILGDPSSCAAADGVGTYARLNMAADLLAIDDQLYVTDLLNFSLRRVSLSAAPVYRIDTIAGVLGEAGFVDGVGSTARFTQPKGMAFDGQSLFIVDREFLRQVDPTTMSVTTLFGKPGCLGAIDGDYTHAGISAALPWGPTLSHHAATGYLYIADGWENVVREIR